MSPDRIAVLKAVLDAQRAYRGAVERHRREKSVETHRAMALAQRQLDELQRVVLTTT